MKLTRELISLIKNSLKVAKSVGVESLIIDKTGVFGTHNDKTVVIVHKMDLSQLPFTAIGIGRIDLLMSRFALVDKLETFTVEAEVSEKTDQVIKLILKSGKTKVEYRTANIATIQAYRNINDPLKYIVQLEESAVQTLAQAQSAMGAEDVTLVANDEGVSFEMVDVNQDVFSQTFSEEIVDIETKDVGGSFAHRYPLKVLLSVIKQNPAGICHISGKGICKVRVSDLDVYVLPLR